jgi:L-lactate dehydrogenase complex protein LldF
MCKGMEFVFNHETVYNTATGMASLANLIPPFVMNMKLNPWAEGHEMMNFPKKPFHELIKTIKKP